MKLNLNGTFGSLMEKLVVSDGGPSILDEIKVPKSKSVPSFFVLKSKRKKSKIQAWKIFNSALISMRLK